MPGRKPGEPPTPLGPSEADIKTCVVCGRSFVSAVGFKTVGSYTCPAHLRAVAKATERAGR